MNDMTHLRWAPPRLVTRGIADDDNCYYRALTLGCNPLNHSCFLHIHTSSPSLPTSHTIGFTHKLLALVRVRVITLDFENVFIRLLSWSSGYPVPTSSG